MDPKTMYATTDAERIRSAKCAAGLLGPDLTIDGMSYNMAQVEAAEQRIRRECPKAKISRDDYGWRLAVATPDKSRRFIVFWHDDDGVVFLGDVDAIIAALKAKTNKSSAARRSGARASSPAARSRPRHSRA